MRRNRLLVGLVGAGLTVAVGVPVGWSLADHPTDPAPLHPGLATALAGPSGAASAGSSAGSPAPGPTAVTSSAASSSGPAQPGSPGVATTVPVSRVGGQSLPVPDRPVRLQIAGIGVDAPVVAVGVDADGEVSIPENVGTLGWYQWSAAPNYPGGSVVIVGHVDSAQQGDGALFRLKTLGAGAVVVVRTADASYTYRVVSRQEYAKTSVPWPALFSTAGAPRLTLVTCGGPFDRATLSYLDNVVVTAVPQ
jgi:hypothetical protein